MVLGIIKTNLLIAPLRMANNVLYWLFVFYLMTFMPLYSYSQNKTVAFPSQNSMQSIDPLKKYDCVFEYNEGLALVRRGSGEKSKFGFIDENKKEIIPCIYDSAWKFSSGKACVKKDGVCFYIDKTGKQIITQIYDDGKTFSHGLAAVKLNNKWGYINSVGIVIVPFIYTSASAHNDRGYAAVSITEDHSTKYGMIDSQCNIVIPLKYDYLRVNLYDHLNGKEAQVKINGQEFYIDLNENKIDVE